MITVAIIGAGPLGRWLALSAARAAFRVLLEDVMPANLHHAQEMLRRELGPAYFAEQLGSGASLDGDAISKCGPIGSAEERLAQDGSQGGGAVSAQDDVAVGVAFVSTIEDAVHDADLAIDCVPDELESKLEIMWLLDRMAPPRTVLMTPTTRLSIADLANCTYRPEKCVAIAAEASSLAAGLRGEILLRTTRRTTAETRALVERFWRRLGFDPNVELDMD